MSSFSIAWTTTANAEDAQKLATQIVEQGLAACVHIDGPLTAVYTWNGKIQTETESRLWIKFPSETSDRLEQWIRERHPYDVPQWIVVSASSVLPEYLQWAVETTGQDKSSD